MSNDFLINFKYQNNLPSAPSGPFFKQLTTFHSFEKFGEYSTSTLEKGYVWQPNFGPDMGLNLDLVDQDTILGQDKNFQQLPLDPSELKYLQGTVDKGRGKLKQIDQSSKPWWLRNTTYMENNLFNSVMNKNHDTESTSKHNEAKRKQIGNKAQDPFAEDFIEDSFKLLDNTIKNLKHKTKKIGIMWEVPIVPLELPSTMAAVADKSYSLVRFDEDPLNSITDVPEQKRRRVNGSIATNFRQSKRHDDQFTKAGAAIEVSLVAPTVATLDASVDGDSSGRYEWVKDYRMEVADSKTDDCFLLLVDQSALAKEMTADGAVSAEVARYFPIRSRVDMRKMNAEESMPHECAVFRRAE